MDNSLSNAQLDLREAFRAHESVERFNNTKVGCILVITLMPAGTLLDYFTYPDWIVPFLKARLLCSAIATVILLGLYTERGRKASPWLGIIVPLLPVVFIAWMIMVTEGFASAYYAGLNLVLLAVGAVLRWTFLESIVAVTLVLGIYILAGIFALAPTDLRTLINNFYFIALMDVIVVVGTYFQYRQRYREFVLRYELDLNKKELEESHQKLVELDQIKNRFFGNISHELRTPLTLLLAPLESMMSRFKNQFDDRTRGLLQTMHSNGMRLLKLINDLLDLVRLESGVIQIKREPIQVELYLQGITDAAQQMAQDKKVVLEFEVTEDVGHVMLDRDRMEKVLLNLQFNALKFTNSGGRVSIRARKSGEELIIEVEDTGHGMPAKQLPHIFDRFWQADGSARKKYQGVGIGLSLVKELVEAHEGHVEVASEEGKGSLFTVHLPFIDGTPHAQPEEPLPALPAADSSSSSSDNDASDDAMETAIPEPAGTVSNQEWLSNLYRRAEFFPSTAHEQKLPSAPDHETDLTLGTKPRVLIADDEFGMREFIRSQLETEFQVVEAEDGQEAIDKANQCHPEVILLDMMMPRKDGLQACKEIRENASTKNIPIVMLTARADEEIKLAALEAGASDFLPKPFSSTELQVRLQNLIDSHEYQRRLSTQNQTLENTIEQLKDAEAQLVESEKLASLGRMSAGIIHEINNPLNYAATGLYTLKQLETKLNLEDKEDYSEIIQDISDGLDRVKTIVSDLRSFAHHNSDNQEQIKFEEIVTPALRFLSHEYKDMIQIEKDLPENLGFEGNKNRMIQVLVNLIQNAIDSMKAKTYPDGESRTLLIEARAEEGRSVLILRDNGEGIKKEDHDKIFDPFFTTKDVGQGMGLGLSICYRIIQDCHGKVTVTSEPGQFCEFKLEFPLTK